MLVALVSLAESEVSERDVVGVGWGVYPTGRCYLWMRGGDYLHDVT